MDDQINWETLLVHNNVCRRRPEVPLRGSFYIEHRGTSFIREPFDLWGNCNRSEM